MQNKKPMPDLRGMREKRKMTQEQLAEKVGIHPMTISYYERGVRVPSQRMLDRIAQALDCEATELAARKSLPTLKELSDAATPMIELLRRNGCPHVTAVITESSVKLVSDEIGIPEMSWVFLRRTGHSG